jgi:hypothetical protein
MTLGGRLGQNPRTRRDTRPDSCASQKFATSYLMFAHVSFPPSMLLIWLARITEFRGVRMRLFGFGGKCLALV